MWHEEKRTKVFVNDNQYCIEKVMNKKRIYTPVDPQPSEDVLLELQRNYATLKVSNGYKRRITWLT